MNMEPEIDCPALHDRAGVTRSVNVSRALCEWSRQ